ncbi:hypothetical protein SH580_11250 [Coraliomargarita algicola]|uniref:Addiction module toxin RelE n=1 Tax=Coraliomargarita algicola TaxID=3092156 RepID=A0ABZ0RM52_9BACT|nr:hypothetical protein [Coraliomargarita sp. J2-16]WPJ94009.1 hypothetical protein SH580_11250 [Coraliomargarita sp. J2-16]
MWNLKQTLLFDRKLKRWAKKHPDELQATFDNLDTYHEHLNSGLPAPLIQLGCIHHEPQGLKAIDQKGGGANLAQTRLYVFPDESTDTLHLITLGDKNSQKSDLKECADFIGKLKKGNSHGH